MIKYFKILITSGNGYSSKRAVAIYCIIFLSLLVLFLCLPYEIKSTNAEIIKIIVGAFTLIATSAFVMNGVENVKKQKKDTENGN